MYDKHYLDLKHFKNILKSKNYADTTIKTYAHHLSLFLTYSNKCRSHLSIKDVDKYLLHIKNSSNPFKNQSISAIKIFYKYILNKNISTHAYERPRKEKKLPRILSKEHVLGAIKNIKNPKHKSIIMIGASVGLRVSEVVNLSIKDIDSDRMVISVRNGKGRKDRIVPLSENVLLTLRSYYREYKPTVYLFENGSGIKYSTSSCNKIVKKYLGSDCHYHLLRHFAASMLMEQDVNIRKIQSILGHSSSKTSEIYTHVTANSLKNLPLAI